MVEAAFRVAALGGVGAAALARVAGLLPEGTRRRLVHEAGWAAPAGWEDCAVAGKRAVDLVVRNADAVLAGEGCEEAVALALSLDVPVLLLSGAGARLLTDRFWAVSVRPAAEGEAAWAGLAERIGAALAPPDGERPAVLEAVEGGVKLHRRAIFRAHRWALEMLSRTPAGGPYEALRLAWWSALYESADGLATGFADRYRSSYTIVLVLAAVAACMAALGLPSEHHHWPFVLPEFAALVLIAAMVWVNAKWDWRARLIQSRLMAELCRKQAALAFVGRSLPATRIAGMTREGALSWIGWRFAAAVRAAPVPERAPEGEALVTARDAAQAVLLHGQIAYHEARAALGKRRERRLVVAGSVLFFGTMALVAVKIGLLLGEMEDPAKAAGLVAALLPAGAAALFGFRAYAELELLVQQSERMMEVLKAAAKTLAGIDPLRPDAGRAIGDVFEETAEEMLADVSGWVQLSQVKAVEAG